MLYCGDNLPLMRKSIAASVDLIYADPPFASDRDYGDFDDRWGSIDGYLDFMRPRVSEMHRLLKPTGSIYLHCDPTASHYLKLVMDAIFGVHCFANEIVWCYTGGGVPKTAFARKHDTLLFYAKSPVKKKLHTFHPQYQPYSEKSQKLVKSRGGVSIDNKPRDLERGATMPDWWGDIQSMQTWTPGRLGYPTQKPVELLDRIIAASSNPGDVILDPFCGCGTTLAAVIKAGDRDWIGMDINPRAISLTKRRLGIADISAARARKRAAMDLAA
jgi:DNA modification methylase